MRHAVLYVVALTVAAAIAGLLLGMAAASALAHDGCNTHACERRVVHPYRPWLARVRACEWNPIQRWATNTGNGFFGAYQFTMQSWRGVGGRGLPHLASPLEQSYRAVRLLHVQGPGAWPECGR